MYLKTVFVILVTISKVLSGEVYLNEWSIRVPGGKLVADDFARENGFVNLGEIIPGSDEYHMKNPRRSKRSVDQDYHIQKRLLGHQDVASAEQLVEKKRFKRDTEYSTRSVRLNDPYWDRMWYLNRGEDLDMNVEGAWQEGVTGRGVAVTILDDGIEKDHPDLIRNYDPLASTDINDNDSDPHPRYDFTDSNRHGTRCAGQVAASPNNSLCAVGIAFNAQIGGIRMLDGQVSDAVEARSLSFNPDHVAIYSSSWGPNDDGKTVDGPGKLAARAFKNGITRGREGKGSIFVWASGNGGRYKDNCNCDGYATSIYTITVSSTSESGQIPWYSEACSSTLATTYSSGTTSERQIVTTDLHHTCTVKHTGTSASAPMAAAIIALTLEANPSLTWRDVQHIIVRTARPANLKAPDWRTNGLGRKVSHSYGYGLMDTTAMVRLAKNWTLMPPQKKCVVASPYYYKVIPAMGYVTIELEVTDCPGVAVLEHVVSPIHVSAGRKRGDFRIYLQSPSGTRATLLDARPQDYSSSGYMDWPFMSVHSWGEDPRGTWTLEVHNDAFSKWASDAKFFKWTLELYGTEFDPNSEEYKRAHVEKFNVVREVKEEQHNNNNMEKSLSTSSTTTTTTTTTTATTTPELRGCISKQGECTRNVSDCRTFTHRSVARVFCKCTLQCVEIGTTFDRETFFNMQCKPLKDPEAQKNKERRSFAGKKPTLLDENKTPVYCQFIPFLSR